MDEQQERDTATDAAPDTPQEAGRIDPSGVPIAPPERSDFEALASRVLALAQHGEHRLLDMVDAACHLVKPEDVETKAKRIAARILSLVESGEWFHHNNIDAAVTVAESQTGGTPK